MRRVGATGREILSSSRVAENADLDSLGGTSERGTGHLGKTKMGVGDLVFSFRWKSKMGVWVGGFIFVFRWMSDLLG